MEDRDLLQSRIDAALAELGWAEGLLDRESLDSRLRRRVRVGFQTEFARRRAALEGERERVASGLALDLGWSSFRDQRRECDALFRECLAFALGAATCGSGLDDLGVGLGLCRLADALLEEINAETPVTWRGFTILAEGEFFNDLASIIRVRFPEVCLWNLPVAAHEFGHFVGMTLAVRGAGDRRRQPLIDYVDSQTAAIPPPRRSQWRSFLHEHFADLFASYVLGPSFACTCIVLPSTP